MRTGAICIATLLALAACGQDYDTAQTDGAIVDGARTSAISDPNYSDLGGVATPGVALARAEVVDRFGEPIGVIDDVDMAGDGSVEAVVIALADGRTVRATPLQARFNQNTATVAVTVNVEQLEQVG
jgi:hypothetical protein